MGISLYRIKKWYRMLMGKSILHVKQDVGKIFSPGGIYGYYNDMTEKVTMQPRLLGTEKLPLIQTETGEYTEFPVTVFQYGLGACDLYLLNKEDKYLHKFLQCAHWAVKHQEKNGAFSNFHYIYPDNPYGAMCQGEGASLLLRAWKHTGDNMYLSKAKAAIDFMLLPVGENGTADYENGLKLLEYTHLPAVLNGWIFAVFGLYDMTLAVEDEVYKTAYAETVKTLIKSLPRFDCPYWSMYDLGGRIASPFYHNLHIAQMEAMYKITGEERFLKYRQKWQRDRSDKVKFLYAFLKKALQKIME